MKMNKLGLTYNECVVEFNELLEQIDDLKCYIDQDSGPEIEGYSIPEAQYKLSKLKNRLENEFKARDTVWAKSRMSKPERESLFPAYHEAFARLTVRRNSKPNCEWSSQLYEIRIDIRFYLNCLNKMFK